jgi:FKBP-type peptidyl-prolyl cis-trans isomerase FklB
MGMMPNHSTFAPRPLLLAATLAGSILPFFVQTQAFAQTSTPAQSSQPATTPAPPKTATAAASKSGTTSGTTAKTGTAKPATAAPALVLKTAKQKRSYAIGADIGKKVGGQLKSQSVELDPAMVARGMRDALSGARPAMTDEEVRTTLTELRTQLQQKQATVTKEASDKNKQVGDAFLAANKGKEGVTTLPSGLQYKILKEGDGKKPAASDTVVCNYRGTLIDGTEFDSSTKHGGPATFPVSGVIKGWTEALQLMSVGSKWQLFIPADLAYGDRGAGGDIGPGATLIFEVELVSIQEKAQDTPVKP